MSATPWKLRSRSISFDDGPTVMGIVNVTPDSFSDGGQFAEPQQAIDHALRLVAEGAAILDIGGESTRPDAEPVDAKEELRRILPVVQSVAEQTDVPISIDTSKAIVAREAIAAGAQIVNDVTGLEGDPQMLGTIVESDVGVCVMHMRGTPATMQQAPQYDDVVVEVRQYLADRRDALVEAGIEPQRIALDPGIGFGKTTEQNVELLKRIEAFHKLGQPLLVGHSRKRFLGELLGNPERDRLGATLGVALVLATQGVQILRVHDVAPLVDALHTFTHLNRA